MEVQEAIKKEKEHTRLQRQTGTRKETAEGS